MHSETLHEWKQGHNFLSETHLAGERNTRRVIALTAAMMVVELTAGVVLGPRTARRLRGR